MYAESNTESIIDLKNNTLLNLEFYNNHILKLQSKSEYLMNEHKLSIIIKQYFLILLFKDINSEISNQLYSDIINSNSKTIDYYKKFSTVKNNIPYLKKFLKLYKSPEFPLKVIKRINDNINNENFYNLSSSIESFYEELKK